jgi:mannose-6-phosphate isomerase-like protein (cupin superfamily)
LDAGVSYTVIAAGDHSWEERPAFGTDEPRFASDLTTTAKLTQSRARIWRLPPHGRGRRHAEAAQEETFVVLEGSLTMLIGDPPERFDLAPQSVVSVRPGTGIQMRNETDAEVAVFVYGAPPVTGRAEYLDDIEL